MTTMTKITLYKRLEQCRLHLTCQTMTLEDSTHVQAALCTLPVTSYKNELDW